MPLTSCASPTRPGSAFAIDILRSLVETPSVSGAERAAIERFLDHANGLGFETRRDDVGNALATRGSESASREIMLLGHIDTVPGDIPVRIEAGVLHGRGAVDAKGPLCAMLCAAARAAIPDDVRLRVVAAVGEETPHSIGARRIAETHRPDVCIIGEPSGVHSVTIGYKGRLLAHATCAGPSGHSAGPDGSPLDHLFRWWVSVDGWIARENGSLQRAFDTVQASLLDARTESDGLRDHAALQAGFRLPPGLEPEELERAVTDLALPGIELRFEGAESAHRVARNDAVVRALSVAISETGARPRHVVKTGTADFNVVGPLWRCPIAAYGPGDSALDHSPKERLELSEYVGSIEILTRGVELLSRRRPHPTDPR